MSDDIRFDTDFRMTIGGRGGAGSTTFAVLNPATEQPAGAAPDCSADELDAAVAAARHAFHGWKAKSIEARSEALLAIANRIDRHVESLALLLTREQGKPSADARVEVASTAHWFREFAKLRLPVEQRVQPDGRTVELRHVPIGVVGAIAPWNFPVSLAVWKVAPALLAGNTVVLKPSPFTPLTTLKLGELLQDLLPPGALNVVSGGDRLGPWLSSHPGIDKIAFTGSTATGRAVMKSAAANLKRLTLELGGNDPAIVLPDVDVDAVANKLFWGAFRNAGQICIAAKRIYVHDAVYDRFASRMQALAERNPPGNGETAGVRIGPVQNRLQFDRVRSLIDDARVTGLRFLSEPGAMDGPGYFIAPTIVDNPPDTARVVVEEPFGPIVPLLRWSDVDDVVRRANDSEFALAASVWSADPDAAAAIARRLEAGTVWINTVQVMSPSIPFGGHKQSGIGVENAIEGLRAYTNLQAIVR